MSDTVTALKYENATLRIEIANLKKEKRELQAVLESIAQYITHKVKLVQIVKEERLNAKARSM